MFDNRILNSKPVNLTGDLKKMLKSTKRAKLNKLGHKEIHNGRESSFALICKLSQKPELMPFGNGVLDR